MFRQFHVLELAVETKRRVADTQRFAFAGLPDGMTVDANGKLWVAVFGGSCIVQIDPETQTQLMSVEVPALCPTSVCFGGIHKKIPHDPTHFSSFVG